MLINEHAFKLMVQDAVKQAIQTTDDQVYQGYADVKQFIEISGISKRHMEDKVIPHPRFKRCVCRFDDSSKRYIHIRKGLDALDEILVKEAT